MGGRGYYASECSDRWGETSQMFNSWCGGVADIVSVGIVHGAPTKKRLSV